MTISAPRRILGESAATADHSARPGVSPKPVEPHKLDVAVNVFDASTRAPISEASVLLRGKGVQLADALRGASNAQGGVAFKAPADDYLVLAQKEGYRAAGVKLTVATGQTNRADIAMFKETVEPEPTPTPAETYNVAGYVVYRDATSTTGIRGVSQVRLTWRRVKPASADSVSTVSERLGRFEVRLPEGAYEVFIEPPAGFEPTVEQVVVEPNMKPQYFHLTRITTPTEPQAVQVAGQVLAASPTTRRYAPAPNAAIHWSRGSQVNTVRSGVDGRFAIRLPAGNYTALAQAEGFDDRRLSIAVREGMPAVQIILRRSEEPGPTPADQAVLTLNIVERRQIGRLARTVPLAGVDIAVSRGGRSVAKGRSQSDGSYVVELAPGIYDVNLAQQGYVGQRVRVTLPPQGANQQIVMTRASEPEPPSMPTLTLRTVERQRVGRITRSVPLAAVDISISRDRRSVAKGRSASDGRYEVQLPAGVYNIVVARQGYIGQPTTVTFPASGAAEEIILTRAAADDDSPPGAGARPQPLLLQFVERAARGQRVTPPVAGAMVTVIQDGKRIQSGQTAAGGIFRVMLPPGKYALKVEKEGYGPAGVEVVVSNRAITERVQLTPVGIK